MRCRRATSWPDSSGSRAIRTGGNFWRSQEESPSGQGYHYNRNADTYMLVGEALGRGMVELLNAMK